MIDWWICKQWRIFKICSKISFLRIWALTIYVFWKFCIISNKYKNVCVSRSLYRIVRLLHHMVLGVRSVFKRNRLSTLKNSNTDLSHTVGTCSTSHLGLIDFRSRIHWRSHSKVDKSLLTLVRAFGTNHQEPILIFDTGNEIQRQIMIYGNYFYWINI